MEEGKREVANALELISRQGLTTMIMIAMILMIFVSIVFMIIVNREELIAVGEERGDNNRRAAVFYFDKVGLSVKIYFTTQITEILHSNLLTRSRTYSSTTPENDFK